MGNCLSAAHVKDFAEHGVDPKDAAATATAAKALAEHGGLPPVDKQTPLKTSVLGRQVPDDVQDEYELQCVLGTGQYGIIRRAVHKETGQHYACKTINKSHLSPQEAAIIRQELQIMHHVAGHPNVVRVVKALEDHSHVHIIMELCSGGDLVELVTARGRYTERDAAAAVRVMLEVVAYCHDMGVMHRDLKLENFLIAGQAREDGCIKATDFGLSTFIKPGQRLSDVCGTAFYMAPEVLMRDYDEKADVWAVGTILYILLCGRPPFDYAKDEDIFRAIMDDGKPDFSKVAFDSISQPAKECVALMMTWDARKRPSAREMLSHPWIRKDGVAGDNVIEPEVLHRLRSFAQMNALKKHTLMFMAQHMSVDEIAGLREMFESMDTDHSGTISLQELREGLLKRGVAVPEELLEAIMDMADANHNRCLDYDEFVGATLHVCKLQQEEKLLEAFQHFDTDGDGFITREELMRALSADSGDAQQLGAEVLQVLQEADKDGDGRIDYKEFVSMMIPQQDTRNNSALEFANSWVKHQQQQQQPSPPPPNLKPLNIQRDFAATAAQGDILNRRDQRVAVGAS